jgi:prepilin-type N-terminal cleavage/methylation domain-containing protein
MRAIFNQGNRGKLARGFTLIELLVVIAIIGILTAIYLPVVARAKAKAKQSNCASNLQQIGLSFRVFAQDSGGRFPMNVRARYGGTMGLSALYGDVQFDRFAQDSSLSFGPDAFVDQLGKSRRPEYQLFGWCGCAARSFVSYPGGGSEHDESDSVGGPRDAGHHQFRDSLDPRTP